MVIVTIIMWIPFYYYYFDYYYVPDRRLGFLFLQPSFGDTVYSPFPHTRPEAEVAGGACGSMAGIFLPDVHQVRFTDEGAG